MSEEGITFVRGNARLEQLLSDPERRARVDAIREGMKQTDHEHAMGLAMIRQAADLTQQDLADFLGVSQVAVTCCCPHCAATCWRRARTWK